MVKGKSSSTSPPPCTSCSQFITYINFFSAPIVLLALSVSGRSYPGVSALIWSVSGFISPHALWKPINPISDIGVSADKSIAAAPVRECERMTDEDQHKLEVSLRLGHCTHIHNIPGLLLPWRWIKVQSVLRLNDCQKSMCVFKCNKCTSTHCSVLKVDVWVCVTGFISLLQMNKGGVSHVIQSVQGQRDCRRCRKISLYLA